MRLQSQLLSEFLKERTLDSQPKILAQKEPHIVGKDMRLVCELYYLTLILAPQRVGVQALLMLTSKHGDVSVMVRSGNLLSDKLLHPKLVVVHYILRTLNHNPVTLVSDDTLRSIELHLPFRVGPRYQTRTGLLCRDRALIRLLHLNEDDLNGSLCHCLILPETWRIVNKKVEDMDPENVNATHWRITKWAARSTALNSETHII
jgi:hypothetical protein